MKVTLFDSDGHHDIDSPDWQTLLASETGTLWVDMTGPTDADVQVMSEVFKFHPLAIEDTRNHEQRPKIEEYAGYQFIILNPSNSGPQGPEFHELDVFVGTTTSSQCTPIAHKPSSRPAAVSVKAGRCR